MSLKNSSLLFIRKNDKKEHIRNICTSSEDIFALADYILKGQKDKALLEFGKLCTNKHYLEILAVLQTNFFTTCRNKN